MDERELKGLIRDICKPVFSEENEKHKSNCKFYQESLLKQDYKSFAEKIVEILNDSLYNKSITETDYKDMRFFINCKKHYVGSIATLLVGNFILFILYSLLLKLF